MDVWATQWFARKIRKWCIIIQIETFQCCVSLRMPVHSLWRRYSADILLTRRYYRALCRVGFWGDGHYWHWPQYPIYEPGEFPGWPHTYFTNCSRFYRSMALTWHDLHGSFFVVTFSNFSYIKILLSDSSLDIQVGKYKFLKWRQCFIIDNRRKKAVQFGGVLGAKRPNLMVLCSF